MNDWENIMTSKSLKRKPGRGAIALCGLNALGLITSDKTQNIEGRDAWVGIQLTDKLTCIGDRWTSRNPKVLCYLDDLMGASPSYTLDELLEGHKPEMNHPEVLTSEISVPTDEEFKDAINHILGVRGTLASHAATQAIMNLYRPHLATREPVLSEALISIARNSCCGTCREAALVAQSALQKAGVEWKI